MEKIKRERAFHNKLAQDEFGSRKVIRRLTRSFYDRDLLWEKCWREIGDLHGKAVLDYGCGQGKFSLALAHLGAKVQGIDISEELVSLAAKNASAAMQHLDFSVMDAHQTDFPDNSFDFVFGNGILHHLNLDEAYSEVARILKPGGKAYFMEPLNSHPMVKIIRKLTPEARSADERPLSITDIESANRYFSRVRHHEFFLLAVIAAPFNIFSLRAGQSATRTLNVLDQFVFKLIPVLKRYAWLSVMQFEK